MLTTIVYGIMFSFAVMVYAVITDHLSGKNHALDIFLIVSWPIILLSPIIALFCGFSWIPFAIGLGIFIPIFLFICYIIARNWH